MTKENKMALKRPSLSLVTSLGFVSAFLLLVEVPLNALIVNKVPCEDRMSAVCVT